MTAPFGFEQRQAEQKTIQEQSFKGYKKQYVTVDWRSRLIASGFILLLIKNLLWVYLQRTVGARQREY